MGEGYSWAKGILMGESYSHCKQTGEFNSSEVQQCRKRREIFRIIQKHFLKSGNLLTLINKEIHSNFGAKMSATAN